MSSPVVSGKRLGVASSGAEQRVRWGAFLVTAALVVAAGVLFAGLFTAIGAENSDALGWDFRATYYPAGEAVVRGASPYPHDVGDVSDVRTVYAYPPQLAFAVAPLTVLPIDVAAVVAMLASFAALMGAIALVGVRDVRCFAALMIWAPVWNALETANVSAFLALLVALAWRFRALPLALASALGVMVSIKLFLWPLIAWAACTRRTAAAVLGCVLAVALTVCSWAAIGFAGLDAYPELLRRVASQESYSLERIGLTLGLGSQASYLASSIVSGLLIVLCVAWERRGDESRALLAAVAAALAGTPVLWLHYLVLLAVPLALLRPRFSALWLFPVVLWICPRSDVSDDVTLFVPCAVTAIFVVALSRRPAESLRRESVLGVSRG
jgi:alpha-1,2-mannosyltransferase